MKVVVLNASPRRDGNSAALADAAARGGKAAGHEVESLFLSDYVEGMLGDCRLCRDVDGACSIKDGYQRLLLEHVVPADGLILATPLHYYGMTGRLKAFIDRLFCYTSNSAPDGDRVRAALPGKRLGLLVSCEETYAGATLGLTAQVQELARYNRQELAGIVVGFGNSRGEIGLDPSRPLDRAEDLGRRLFSSLVTDYRLDTPRSNRVWPAGELSIQSIAAGDRVS